MIRALVTGSLYGEPQARTSQSGKKYASAKLRADGKDGSSVWCSLIAFGEQADRLMTLSANAAVPAKLRLPLTADNRSSKNYQPALTGNPLSAYPSATRQTQKFKIICILMNYHATNNVNLKLQLITQSAMLSADPSRE